MREYYGVRPRKSSERYMLVRHVYFFCLVLSHLINTPFIAIFRSGSWIYLFQDTKHRKENCLCSQTPCEPPRFCSSPQKFSMLYGYFVSLEISPGRKLDDIFTRIGLPLLRLMQLCLSRSSFKPELWVSLNRVMENTFREGKRISGQDSVNLINKSCGLAASI